MEKIDLSVLQDLVYSIFVEFDRICRDHDIKYSMEGGTLLGAVKYGGFVPWDDDIDVIMQRDQYEKFLSIAPGELNEKFFLQSYNNVHEFPLNYAKLCLNGTMICDYDYSHLKKMNHGVFIDIFPIDHVVPQKLRMHCSAVGAFTGARKTKLKIKLGVKGFKAFVYKALLLLPHKTLAKALNKICGLYNKRKTGYIYEVCNSNRKFAPLPSVVYGEYVELPFRGKSFMAIKEYDALLRSRFGENYLTELPDEDKRKPSHNQNIKIIDKNLEK